MAYSLSELMDIRETTCVNEVCLSINTSVHIIIMYRLHPTKDLVVLLHSANMVQHAKERTHISGHIIDLVVAREGQNILGNLQVSSMLSEHFIVQADLRMSRPRPREKTFFLPEI